MWHESRTRLPLVRLGIFRSGALVRANLGAMVLFGSWVGFQFILTLYLQQLRGWSAFETGVAIFPAGLLVALISSRIALLVGRFGTTRLIIAGLALISVAYALFLPIGLHSSYQFAMLPTFILPGLGFGLAFAPLNIAATMGVPAHEQGLAGGLINTSFQFGGALVLAVVTAVDNANTGNDGTKPGLLDGFHPAIVVSLIAALVGLLVMTISRRSALPPSWASMTRRCPTSSPRSRPRSSTARRRAGCHEATGPSCVLQGLGSPGSSEKTTVSARCSCLTKAERRTPSRW